MEKDLGLIRLAGPLNQNRKAPENGLWKRQVGNGERSICFATAFILDERTDLTAYAKTLPEGVVLCDTGIIAGINHVEGILLQTREYWKRNEKLVRNGLIEILMRLSGRNQISEAVEDSKIQNTKSVALLGLVSEYAEIEESIARFQSTFKTTSQNLKLLELRSRKSPEAEKTSRLAALALGQGTLARSSRIISPAHFLQVAQYFRTGNGTFPGYPNFVFVSGVDYGGRYSGEISAGP